MNFKYGIYISRYPYFVNTFLKNCLNFPSQYSTFRYQILSIKILMKKENTFYIINYLCNKMYFLLFLIFTQLTLNPPFSPTNIKWYENQ